MGKEDRIQAPKELKFLRHGRLNLLVLRQGKSVEKIDVDTPAFLSDERVVKASGMDTITFQPNCVFKVTLDFKEPLLCVSDDAVREATDWVLMSCMGGTASFNRTEERLVLQYCSACVGSTVAELQQPVNMTLRFTEDNEWIVEKCYR